MDQVFIFRGQPDILEAVSGYQQCLFDVERQGLGAGNQTILRPSVSVKGEMQHVLPLLSKLISEFWVFSFD